MATHSFTRGNLGCLLFMQYKNKKKTPVQNNLKPQKELCGMERWVNGVVAPIQQPSDGDTITSWDTTLSPLPSALIRLSLPLSLSIWPSLLYKSTPDPRSTFQHLLINFMCIALPQKDNLLQTSSIVQETKVLCFYIQGKIACCLFLFECLYKLLERTDFV